MALGADAVLCFEGEHQQAYRIIRSVKNRFGSTNEIGVFEMMDEEPEFDEGYVTLVKVVEKNGKYKESKEGIWQ